MLNIAFNLVLSFIFTKANLVKDGLVRADETPLEHLLLSIRVSHRVTDVEQLRGKINYVPNFPG